MPRPAAAHVPSVVLALPALLLAGAHPAARADDTVLVAFAVAGEWGSGFQGELSITNQASWTITDWALAFDAAWSIGSIWNAAVWSHVGTHYVIGGSGASWDDGDLSPGETVVVGWIGNPGAPQPPQVPALNGAPIVLGVPWPAPAPPPLAAAPPWPDRFFSPFIDATLWPLFELVPYATERQVPFLTLGFVTAQDAQLCDGAFGGYAAYSVASGFRAAEINALRGLGGDVRVSFGGAAGVELALACGDVESLRAAYEEAIDAYGLTHIDFDIEGFAVVDGPSIERRSQAIRLLQDEAIAEERTLHVTFTLPVLPTGLVPSGVAVLDAALSHGVRLDGVNIMAMDYGPAAAPNPAGQMGEYAIAAATSLHQQLAELFALHGVSMTPAQVWAVIGITPMIGHNDVVGEIFELEDAVQVLAFAQANAIGSLSFWDANRDLPCPGSVPQPSNTCSGIDQAPYEFSQILRVFTAASIPGDLDGDGMVGGADLGQLLAAWGTAGGPADLDGSGVVDGADLGLLLGAWTG